MPIHKTLQRQNSMFNRLKFNNLVITNKKLIQQARAQTISKLVHKLRKIKDVLAKKPEQEKQKERLRKSAECVAQLKSFKSVAIMRQMLLLGGTNHNAVLTNGRATPEEVALAMLALNKVMQQVIGQFQKELSLSDKPDADWRQEILETSKRRAKLERTEEKRRKRKDEKEQKAQTRNREEWLEKNQADAGETASNAGIILTGATEEETTATGVWKVEEVEATEEAKKPKLKEHKIKVEKTKVNATKPQEKKPQQKNNKIKVEKVKVEAAKPERKEQPNHNKIKVEKVKVELAKPERKEQPSHNKIKVETKPRQEEQLTKNPRSRESQTIAKIEKERPTHVIDPFFITETGEHYMSTAVVLSGDSHSESEEEVEAWRSRGRGQQRPNQTTGQRQEYNRPEYNRQDYNRPEYNRQEYNGEKRPWTATPAANDDRHPSWVAKQQQKPIIANFQGKKIKFGDDASPVTITPAFVATPAAVDDSNAGMHPSWIAKQKLKPKIATFTGTKIKFDDDD